MQLQLIKRNKIDVQKYNSVISNSDFPIIYAFSWYLDIVCNENWDVLILGDYEAVMPIPYARLKRNFMFKTIAQPMFCQQLGVFGNSVSKKALKLMYTEMIKQKITSYQFNEGNELENNNLQKKVNYILSLNNSYEMISNNYRKDRMKDVRRGKRSNWEIKSLDDTNFYMDKLSKHLPIYNKKSAQILRKLLQKLKDKNLLVGKRIINENGEWMAMAFWIISYNRRILLTSVRHKINDKKGAFACLIDDFIYKNANNDIIFDFEGSMIPGIADFNSSFGAVSKKYDTIKGVSLYKSNL